MVGGVDQCRNTCALTNRLHECLPGLLGVSSEGILLFNMTYYAARLEEFNAMRAAGMYRATVSRNGVSAYGIATPVRIEKRQTQGPYMPNRDTIIDLLRTDYVALGLDVNVLFNMVDASGIEHVYQVQDGVKDDPSEPTVQLPATKKK